MSRYFVAFFLCITLSVFSEEEEPELILSTPGEIAALTSSYLVGGFVSPLSGQVVLGQTDLIAKGAQDVVLRRMYLPPYIPAFPKHHQTQEEWDKYHLYTHLMATYKGWQFLPHLRLQYNAKKKEVRLTEPNGITLDYRISGQTICISPSYALSNTSGETPSGQFDPRNTRITFQNNSIVVHSPDGTNRFYAWKGAFDPIQSLYFYLLEKEILPNGKVLCYTYDENHEIRKIQSKDPKEQHVYASIEIKGSSKKERCQFTSSSGISAEYTYKIYPLHVNAKGKVNVEMNGTYPPVLTHVNSPSYRNETICYDNNFLLDSYSGLDLFSCQFFGDPYQIQTLLLPVGKNDSPYPVYHMDYDPPIPGKKEGKTSVKKSDGTSIVYHFSKNLLTKTIQYFKDKKLKKEKHLFWNQKNWLTSIEWRDDQNNLLSKRSYQYDRFGNPILEIFAGNLTGEGVESYTIRRQFSQDGKLLLKKEYDDDKVICYSYLPETNLVTAKFVQDRDHIFLRSFFEYDDCYNLICQITDDGNTQDKNNLSGVTERTLKRITLRQNPPFLHMPERVEELYFEGEEKLLKRTFYTYDQYGNIAQETVYDSNGEYAYTIGKEYDEQGNLLSETNALGQKAYYLYDQKARLTQTTNFSGRLQKNFRYDLKGRLIEEKEQGENTLHTTLFEYDTLDHLIQKTDPFLNVTQYQYDPLVDKATKTEMPPITINDQIVPVTTCSNYDPFGRQLTKTDANGNTTTYCYNAYSSPTEITYSDGTQESFRYTKDGKIESHKDPDGLITKYTYDVFDRPLSKTYSFREEKLAEETYTYNSFHLIAETDKEGNTAHYHYDGAGRKIAQDFCGQIIEFAYNSLGHLSKVCQCNADNSLYTHYQRDLLGRILEEKKTDRTGHILYKIQYTYDEDGNKKIITRHMNGKEATHTFTYDPFGKQVEHLDPQGNLTKTTYNENHINQLGQQGLQIETQDPLCITTLETKDPYNRTTKKETTDPQGTIARQEKAYDPHGNLIFQKDHIYQNKKHLSTQTTTYTYLHNRIQSITRANQRTTSYTHTPSEKIATKTLPNGTTLFYEYHPLGHLKHLSSSDKTIDHTFEHDKIGRLLVARDPNITIQRKLDPFGNILKETFSTGLELKKTYDALNRCTHIDFGKHGQITYQYDPLFLRTVTRTTPNGNHYTHTYESYDLNGNLVTETPIGNLGQTTYVTNTHGRKTQISNPYFFQQCTYDPLGNLITQTIDENKYNYTYDSLSQLVSEKNRTYTYDSLYNRTEQNNNPSEVNDLNELITQNDIHCSYDPNGNLIKKQTPHAVYHLTYDPLNRLIQAETHNKKIQYTYDPLNRLLSKTTHTQSFFGPNEKSEYYLYNNQDEIGAFSSGTLKNFRTLGNSTTIAIELENKVFAPILDTQGNISRLVTPSQKIADHYEYTAFGEELSESVTSNPWRFASKRHDPDLNLIHFGKRYYDPTLGRWLTTDPAGFIDSTNPYQFLFNNPFRYTDPHGEFVIAIPLLFWGASTAAVSTIAISEVVIATGVLTTWYLCQRSEFASDYIRPFLGMPLAIGAQAQDSPAGSKKKKDQKNTDVYAPDRPLPHNQGVRIPDTDAPHTQLGQRDGSNGKYPQAREFDKDGKPVRDIDFTDHGYPQNHPNPHQHTWKENPTGGSRQRGKEAEPLPEWKY